MPQILLISQGDDQPAAAALAAQVLDHHDRADRPELDHRAADDLLDDQQVPETDVVWLYTGGHLSAGMLYGLIDLLAQRSAPVLLSGPDAARQPAEPCDGTVMVAPPESEPETLHHMLEAMICAARASEHTRRELALLRRQHAGVSGQMSRLDEELRLACRIQRQFLPPTLPRLAGVRFDVLFRPAGYVSGDIYDVQILDRHHSAFYVADAVGHGVPAALLTMFIKQSLQPRDVHGDEPRILQPNEALARLNHDMCLRQHGPTQFATACYGLLDIRARELLLARAGHPPPVLVRANGEVELLQPEGALLGVFEEETFELHRIDVEEGDRLLIYSDGFEFAFSDGGADAIADYAAELRRLCDGPIEEVVARIEHRLDQQAGSLHQQDDLTALLIDITPQPAENASTTAARPAGAASPA